MDLLFLGKPLVSSLNGILFLVMLAHTVRIFRESNIPAVPVIDYD